MARTGHATQPSAGDRRRGALSAPAGGGLARSGQVCNPRPRRPGQYSLTAWRDCTALPVAGDRGRWSTHRGDGDAVGRDLGVPRADVVLRSWRPSAVKAQASGAYPPLHCETSKTRAGDAISAQRSESHLEPVAHFRATRKKCETAGAMGRWGGQLPARAQPPGCGREIGRLLSTRPPFPQSQVSGSCSLRS